MLIKAQSLATDMVFLDLEDAVAPAAKVQARTYVVAALTQGEWGSRIRSVRINSVGTTWALRDVITVVEGAGQNLDTIMLPKCSSSAQVHWLDQTLTMLESSLALRTGSIGIEVQIEDAEGLTNVDEIAAASTRTQALHFGPGDFQASMGIPTTALGRSFETGGGDPLHHVLGRILVAARTHGLQALDGPHPAIKDLDGLAAASARVAAMGYDGKWVLHPHQVDVVNAAFTPEQADFDRACHVVEAYALVTSVQGGATGAVMLDGEMVDEATRAMAVVVMHKGAAAGLTRSGSTD